ncbi:unnamed protein product, partial [Choristocarpus tenellus]
MRLDSQSQTPLVPSPLKRRGWEERINLSFLIAFWDGNCVGVSNLEFFLPCVDSERSRARIPRRQRRPLPRTGTDRIDKSRDLYNKEHGSFRYSLQSPFPLPHPKLPPHQPYRSLSPIGRSE